MSGKTEVEQVKELKERIAHKKSERVLQLVRLGEKTVGHYREGNLQIPDLIATIEAVQAIDIELFTTGKQLQQLNRNHEVCENCHEPLSSYVKFCGSCGQLNAHYMDQQQQYISCHSCAQEIEIENIYCPCCGKNQKG